MSCFVLSCLSCKDSISLRVFEMQHVWESKLWVTRQVSLVWDFSMRGWEKRDAVGSRSRFGERGRGGERGRVVFSHRGPAFLTLKDWLNIIERFPFVVGASRRHPRVSSAQSALQEAVSRPPGPGSGRSLHMIDRRGTDSVAQIEMLSAWLLITNNMEEKTKGHQSSKAASTAWRGPLFCHCGWKKANSSISVNLCYLILIDKM